MPISARKAPRRRDDGLSPSTSVCAHGPTTIPRTSPSHCPPPTPSAAVRMRLRLRPPPRLWRPQPPPSIRLVRVCAQAPCVRADNPRRTPAARPPPHRRPPSVSCRRSPTPTIILFPSPTAHNPNHPSPLHNPTPSASRLPTPPPARRDPVRGRTEALEWSRSFSVLYVI